MFVFKGEMKRKLKKSENINITLERAASNNSSDSRELMLAGGGARARPRHTMGRGFVKKF